MQLRPHQVTCEQHILEDYKAGFRTLLALMPTGAGKTILFARAPKWFPGKRVLILAHTEELVGQAYDKLHNAFPHLSIGVEMAEQYSDSGDTIVIGSVPTLGRAGSDRLSRFNPLEFGVVVVDECHHIVADSYQRVINFFGFGLGSKTNPDCLLLGVTATSNRGDGVGLSDTFEKVTYQYSLLQAIKDGWICPPIGYRVRTDVSLDDVHALYDDLNKGELSNAVNTPRRNKLIVQEWLKHGQNRQSLGFTVDIKHALDLASEFRSKGVKAEAIWGEDPERDRKLERHKAGLITVLLNCGVLTEGYDDWQVSCIILARPTKSTLLFIQMIGRGLRLQDGLKCSLMEALAAGMELLKRDCIVLDFDDITTKHSLVTLPSLFGLPSQLKVDGKEILEVLEEMAELEEANPQIDFSTLDDLSNAEAYIEHVNLFSEAVDPVIAGLSQWRWMLTAKGNYVLKLPNEDSVVLSQNMLGHWEIKGNVSFVEFEDFDADLGNSVCTAEGLIKQFWKGRKSTLVRKDRMPGDNVPASEQQIAKIVAMAAHRGQPAPDMRGVSYFKAQQIISSY